MNEEGVKIAVIVFNEASKILEAKMIEGLQTIKIQKIATEFVGEEVPIEGNHHILLASQLIPSIVLNAFSVELNLKLLVFQKTAKTKFGHELDKLFNELDNHTKEIIVAHVCSELNIDGTKFKDILNESAKTFIDWRYFYENQQNANVLFLKSFGASIAKLTQF